MVGCFANAGQSCVAPERLLVFDSVYEEFADRLGELVARLRQGVPGPAAVTDVGAITTPRQLAIVEQLVVRAVAQGARVVAGGVRVLAERGDYYAPTVLADVTTEMEIMREETFGPVATLCRVCDEDEAVRVANDTAFGLSSSVFSKDRARARRIAARIEAGSAAINDFGGLTYMAQGLPFGGVKASGIGRMNGREGLRACCNVKAVLDHRLAVRTVGRVYPVRSTDFECFRAGIQLLYGRGSRRRLIAIAALVRAVVASRRRV
jgi:acyl-CoA reductase-like NAD-dependent aldehyde dehydrogenase